MKENKTIQPADHARPATASGTGDRYHHDASQPVGELPLVLSFTDMNTATRRGLVTVLGCTAGYAVKYNDAWWIADDRGWVRVVVDEIAAVLDAEHDRMAAQDATVTRAAAIRAAISENRPQMSPPNGRGDPV